MPYRAQSVNRLTERVHAAIRASARAVDVRHVLIACSGGADSTCLVHAIAATASATGWTVTIGHIQHRARMGDEEDMRAVHALADRLHLPFRSLALVDTTREPTHRVSEGTLRSLRYRSLAILAAEVGAQAILTGHTMDDQAETLLLHLIRGAGIDGLAGIAHDSPVPLTESFTGDGIDAPPNAICLVRPLLAIRHEETVAYCAAHVLPIVHDPTNGDQGWTRNWIRHTIIPELRSRNPDIAATLARSAGHLAHDAAFLRDETTRALERCGHRSEFGVSLFEQSNFAREQPALRGRIIRRLTSLHAGVVPDAETVQRAAATIATSRTSRLAHTGPVSYSIVRGRVILGTTAAVQGWIRNAAVSSHPLYAGTTRLSVGMPLAFPPLPGTHVAYSLVLNTIAGDETEAVLPAGVQRAYLALPEDRILVVRNRRPGDRFRPADRGHTARLQDYLTEREIPAPVRDLLPLLVVDGTIAWVIGHDVGADFLAARADATHVALLWRQDA